jgi:hypothetical protein
MKSLRLVFNSLLLLPLLAAILAPAPAAAQSVASPSGLPELEVLAWAIRLRAERGMAALQADPALERCAREYASVLAASGTLAHRDARGLSALQRYRRAGGSAARVGEVLGAGPGLPEVTAAWVASPAHAAVVLRGEWTHAGAGAAARGPVQVWVLLFAEQPVDDFQLRGDTPGGYLLTGRFRAPEAAEPVLLSGLRALPARRWQAAERRFAFAIPAEAGRLYHRLGYRTLGGRWVLTDAFFPEAVTSFPETAPR